MKKRKLILTTIPMITGIIIYLLYRSKKLLYFKALDGTTIQLYILKLREIAKLYRHVLSTWTIYSLPDGLWLFSYGAALLMYRPYYKLNICFFTGIYFFSVIAEIVQKYWGGAGSRWGTYDIHDILAYTIAYILVIIISYFFNKYDYVVKKNTNLKAELIVTFKYSIIFIALGIIPSLM